MCLSKHERATVAVAAAATEQQAGPCQRAYGLGLQGAAHSVSLTSQPTGAKPPRSCGEARHLQHPPRQRQRRQPGCLRLGV